MKKVVIILLEIILIIGIIITLIYNIVNNKTFFSATVTQILTLIIAFGFAFWATQYKADQRKIKENIEKIIENIRSLITDSDFYTIDKSMDLKLFQMQINAKNRRINNYITVLLEYAKIFKFNGEIEYIQEQFKTYRERIGDHITDLDYLKKSEAEFKKISENIDSKCDAIILHLYK